MNRISPIIDITYKRELITICNPETNESVTLTPIQLIAIIDDGLRLFTGKVYSLSLKLPTEKEKILELYNSKIS